MRFSIRSFLLINLLLSVVLITSLMVIANLYLNHKELKNNTNRELALSALTIEALLSDNPTATDLSGIQNGLDSIPSLWQQISSHPNSPIKKNNIGKNFFQILDKHNNLLLSSHYKFPKPLASAAIGFSDTFVNHVMWRTFVTRDPVTEIKIITAERHDFHQDLEDKIAANAIFILLLALPILGLLLWLIVGRGLSSIKEVTKEIKNRAPDDMKKMSLSGIPTEIKPLVEELNLLFNKVEEAFLREERFSSDAAHELRTPLAALRAHVHVALNATSDEERNKSLRKIIDGIDRGTHVVQQLLTLSRSSKSKVLDKIKTSTADLKSVATEIIAELYPLASNKKIELELIAPKHPTIVMGDSIMIGVLIKNLIDNAIRYIQEGAFIQVVIVKTHRHIVLKIIDNGPGIPKKIRKQVFERFFRGLDNTAPGSGLGLSIVQQIATYHKAKIELNTPPSGKGLEVDITFPKVKKSK